MVGVILNGWMVANHFSKYRHLLYQQWILRWVCWPKLLASSVTYKIPRKPLSLQDLMIVSRDARRAGSCFLKGRVWREGKAVMWYLLWSRVPELYRHRCHETSNENVRNVFIQMVPLKRAALFFYWHDNIQMLKFVNVNNKTKSCPQGLPRAMTLRNSSWVTSASLWFSDLWQVPKDFGPWTFYLLLRRFSSMKFSPPKVVEDQDEKSLMELFHEVQDTIITVNLSQTHPFCYKDSSFLHCKEFAGTSYEL